MEPCRLGRAGDVRCADRGGDCLFTVVGLFIGLSTCLSGMGRCITRKSLWERLWGNG